jgi:hypothetical protein
MLTILFFIQCILHTVATDVMYFSCSALLCMHTSMIVIHSVLHVILGQAMRLLYSAKPCRCYCERCRHPVLTRLQSTILCAADARCVLSCRPRKLLVHSPIKWR